MVITRPVFVAFAMFTILLSACSNHDRSNTAPLISQTTTSYKKQNFDSLMLLVLKGPPPEFHEEELLGNRAFTEIFEHSPYYLADVRNLLNSPHLTDREASTCIFAMQNLAINNYVKLCRELYDEHKISEEMLEDAILRGFLNKNMIADNHNELTVIALLNTIHDKPQISQKFKKAIEDTLSPPWW